MWKVENSPSGFEMGFLEIKMSHNCKIQHRKIENKPNFQKMQQFRRWKQLWSLYKHMKMTFSKAGNWKKKFNLISCPVYIFIGTIVVTEI